MMSTYYKTTSEHYGGAVLKKNTDGIRYMENITVWRYIVHFKK